VILRCLEPEAAKRYPSAAQLAFDLSHPQQVIVTARGERVARESAGARFKRWLKAAGLSYQPSPLPSTRVSEAPIVMVAVPWRDATDATLYSLRESAQRSLHIRPGARLACVTVVGPGDIDHLTPGRSETDVHRVQLDRLRQWAQGLDLSGRAVSWHVIESSDTAAALLHYARSNAVDLMILGAATHGLKLQRLVATVPMRVAMEAPCSVLLVKQGLPFEQLARAPHADNAA
jgi:eukaryotic-like serine/threonine-protein kinase